MLPNWIYYFLGKKSGGGPTPPTPTGVVVPNGMKFSKSKVLPQDFANWDFSNVIDGSAMFDSTYFSELPLIDVSTMQDCGNFLSNNTTITTLPHLHFDSIGSMSSGFYKCTSLSGSIELSYKWVQGGSHSWSLQSLFGRCTSIENVKLNISSDYTRHFDGSYMFDGCTNLKKVELNFIGNTGINNFKGFFNNCTSLEDVPVINLYGVGTTYTNLGSMFNNCTSLTNQSLDNILQSCLTSRITSTNYKNLSTLNVNSMYDSIIPTLPHYQDFLNARLGY